MKKIFIFLCIATTFTGCSSVHKDIQKTQEEIKPVTSTMNLEDTFSKEIISILEEDSKKKIEPLLVTRWFPDKDIPGASSPNDVPENAISIRSLPKSKAKEIFNNHYDQFYKEGYLMFLTNFDFDDSWNPVYDLAVIKASNQYEIVKLINTEAPNYDITNDQIIEKLKEWEESIPFRIVVVDEDRVEAEILMMPDNVASFAIKIFDFSPDTVYQGADSLEELAKEIEKEKYFWLWWD